MARFHFWLLGLQACIECSTLGWCYWRYFCDSQRPLWEFKNNLAPLLPSLSLLWRNRRDVLFKKSGWVIFEYWPGSIVIKVKNLHAILQFQRWRSVRLWPSGLTQHMAIFYIFLLLFLLEDDSPFISEVCAAIVTSLKMARQPSNEIPTSF